MLVILSGGWANAQFREPDLVVENVEINPATPKVGQQITIRADIVNLGRDKINERFDTTVRMDGTRLQTFRIRFTGTQKRTIELTWEATEGQHLLQIEVDEPRDAVEERNERNNTAQLTFSVGPDSNIESFTQTAIATQALAWSAASQALAINTGSTNLLLLLDLIKGAFAGFSKAFTIAEATLRATSRSWPQAFADHDAVTPLLPDYDLLKNAAGQIEAGLDQLDLDSAIVAMQDIEVSMRNLAGMSSISFPLGGLSEAADAFHVAIEAALEAQVRFGDSSQGDANESIGRLIDEVAVLGDLLARVGEDLNLSMQTNTARFVDDQGASIQSLSGDFSLTIRAPGLNLTFQVVDEAGTSILSLSVPDSTLTWQGVDAQGTPLRAQRYFFRVRWTGESQPTELDDVGTLVVD